MDAGCDIAVYQGAPDFAQLKTAAKFVFVKATEGTGLTDDQFARNWSEARRVGIQRGAYHFAHPDLGLDPDDEAAYFVQTVGPLSPGDMLALDLERDCADPVGWSSHFLAHVRSATGTAPFIYINLSTLQGHDWSPVRTQYPLWLALYDGQPNTRVAGEVIKQWSGSGTHIAGVQGEVDLDTAFEDLTQYGLGGAGDMNEDQVKQVIRVMLGSDEGVALVRNAILAPNGYGPALQAELEGMQSQITDAAAQKAAAAIADAVSHVPRPS